MNRLKRLMNRACPRFECKSIRRSHRVGFMERFPMRMSFIQPYRCLDCDKRFYLYDSVVPVALPRRSLDTTH
jgi:hypothetical protein